MINIFLHISVFWKSYKYFYC